MSRIKTPCLNCGTLVPSTRNRCKTCQTAFNRLHPKPPRPHYQGDYKARARKVRTEAFTCWICTKGYDPNDPWTADHVITGDPESPLLAAHRSCNSRRGAQTQQARKRHKAQQTQHP